MGAFLKITAAVFFIIIALFSVAFCADETTITTYYPSPYGVYRELRLFPQESAPTDCNSSSDNEGAMYYNNSENSVYVCDGSAWKKIGAEVRSVMKLSQKDEIANPLTCPSGWQQSTTYNEYVGMTPDKSHVNKNVFCYRTDIACQVEFYRSLPSQGPCSPGWSLVTTGDDWVFIGGTPPYEVGSGHSYSCYRCS